MAISTRLQKLLQLAGFAPRGVNDPAYTELKGVLDVVDAVSGLSSTELGLLDGSIAGTAVASKALALGANKNVDTLVIAASGLKIGSGAGTAVTSTAAELNLVDDQVASATFSIAAEAADAIVVSIQLKDAAGNDMAVRSCVWAYLSDDANGDAIVATPHDGTVAGGTDGMVAPVIAKKLFLMQSEADGDIDLSITETGAKTAYLVVVLPNGKRSISAAITHAA